MTVDKRASLIQAFQKELKRTRPMASPRCIDSFANLWEYEFGSFETLPPDLKRLVAYRAAEIGWTDDDV